MDWFDKILETSADIYTANRGVKMEQAKVQQAQILATVEKDQQPSSTPVDAKQTAVSMPGANTAPASGFLPGIPRPYLYAGAAVGLLGLLFLVRSK